MVLHSALTQAQCSGRDRRALAHQHHPRQGALALGARAAAQEPGVLVCLQGLLLCRVSHCPFLLAIWTLVV